MILLMVCGDFRQHYPGGPGINANRVRLTPLVLAGEPLLLPIVNIRLANR